VVVVLDNVDRLAAKEPEAFAHLLEAAAAHSAPYRLILVSGDPAVVKQVQGARGRPSCASSCVCM
jgi:hypothetical protein